MNGKEIEVKIELNLEEYNDLQALVEERWKDY